MSAASRSPGFDGVTPPGVLWGPGAGVRMGDSTHAVERRVCWKTAELASAMLASDKLRATVAMPSFHRCIEDSLLLCSLRGEVSHRHFTGSFTLLCQEAGAA